MPTSPELIDSSKTARARAQERVSRLLPSISSAEELDALTPGPGDSLQKSEDKLFGAIVASVESLDRESPTHVATVSTMRALDVTRLVDGQLFATSGYYSSGDGGHATYRFVGGSTATHDGGSVIAPANGVPGRFLLLDFGVVNVRQWGAKGDYTNGASGKDDTARIQAAITYGVSAGRRIYIPAGNYGLTASLKLPPASAWWSIAGDGGGTILTQQTVTGSGEAIFEFTGANISNFQISDLRMFWYNPVGIPVSSYRSCGFLFAYSGGGALATGVYNFVVRNVYASFGFRFVSNYDLSSSTSSGVNVWGSTFQDCRVSYFNGGAARLTNAGAGSSPNLVFRNFYVIGRTDGAAIADSVYVYPEEIFYIQGVTGTHFEGVEINNVRLNAAFIISLIGGPGSSALLSNVRVEVCRFSLTGGGVVNSFNVGTTISSMDISALYVDAAQSTIVVKHVDTDSVGHKLVVLNLDQQNNGSYPTFVLGAGASAYLVDGTPGSLAFVGNMPVAAGALRFGGLTPTVFGYQQWRRNYAYVGGSVTPTSHYTNDAVNWFVIESATATLNIGAIGGATAGQEYVVEIRNSGGTVTSLVWAAAYLTAGDTLPVGSGKRKTVRFIYDGTNFIQIGAATPSY